MGRVRNRKLLANAESELNSGEYSDEASDVEYSNFDFNSNKMEFNSKSNENNQDSNDLDIFHPEDDFHSKNEEKSSFTDLDF